MNGAGIMIGRRLFLTLPAALFATGRKNLRGIFPIMQTPFSPDNQVDHAVLAKQVHFLERCGVHGMVWPQLASEYMTLTRDERIRGAEAILSAGKGIRPAIVIGVQASETSQAIEYARHATRLGADALIAIPPQGVESKTKDHDAILAYYKALGESSPLPLFVQAVGDMPLDFIVRLSKAVPTLRYIKDESGPTLNRITEFKVKAPELHSFSGSHGKNLYEEMLRGSAGNMPAAAWADLYVSAWELFHSGDRRRAAEMCARADLLVAAIEPYGMEAIKYILHLRGVFPGWKARRGGARGDFDSPAQQAIRELLDHLKPHLRA